MQFSPFKTDIEEQLFAMLARKKRLGVDEIRAALGEAQEDIEQSIAHLQAMDLIERMSVKSGELLILTRDGVGLARKLKGGSF